MTAKRSGQSSTKSVGRQITQYDAELINNNFTWQDNPNGKTRSDGVLQQNWKQYVETAQKLGFDTKSSDSLKELEKMFNTTQDSHFRKQGGILNYLTLFS